SRSRRPRYLREGRPSQRTSGVVARSVSDLEHHLLGSAHRSRRGGRMHELVIRGGTVVDGTGAPATTADVALSDGRITAGGRAGGPAARAVHAGGGVAAPGWVDIHTHYAGQVTWDAGLTPASWHGATTVVMGNCGVGFAPVRPGSE